MKWLHLASYALASFLCFHDYIPSTYLPFGFHKGEDCNVCLTYFNALQLLLLLLHVMFYYGMLSCSMLLVIHICHSVDRYCREVSLTKIWASLLTKMLTVLHFVGRSFSCLIYPYYTLYPLDVYPFLILLTALSQCSLSRTN